MRDAAIIVLAFAATLIAFAVLDLVDIAVATQTDHEMRLGRLEADGDNGK